MYGLDGDFSENNDWSILLEKSGNLYQKIALLKEKIIATEKNAKQGRISKIITYQLLENGEEKTIKLTNEWEADPFLDKISTLSPLGLALTNKEVGEIIEVKAVKKVYKVQIISIR